MKKITILLYLIIAVVILLLFYRFYFSQGNYDVSNPAWNGISSLTAVTSHNNLNLISDLWDKDGASILLIAGPTINYTKGESQYILSFMQRGGTVVVADDYGTANTLLYNLSSPVTFNQQPLCQDDNYYTNPAFPIIANFGTSAYLSNVTELMLNHPVSLNVSGSADIIASTSRLGWVDIDDDYYIDTKEQFGQYPVIASSNYGPGTLIVISDPDLFSNGMADKGDNSQFIYNIFYEKTIYIDVSHGHGTPPLAEAFYIIKSDFIAQLLCVLLVVVAGYAFYRRRELLTSLYNTRRKSDAPHVAQNQLKIDYMKAKLPVKARELDDLKKKT